MLIKADLNKSRLNIKVTKLVEHRTAKFALRADERLEFRNIAHNVTTNSKVKRDRGQIEINGCVAGTIKGIFFPNR